MVLALDLPVQSSGRSFFMGLYYQTEYRLGRQGGRVCRNYTGIRAFLAIAIDLFIIVAFDLVFALLFLFLRVVLKFLQAVAYVLALPFRFARWLSLKLGNRGRREAVSSPLKPAWASYDEI
jgi:hypothetical protein